MMDIHARKTSVTVRRFKERMTRKPQHSLHGTRPRAIISKIACLNWPIKFELVSVHKINLHFSSKKLISFPKLNFVYFVETLDRLVTSKQSKTLTRQSYKYE